MLIFSHTHTADGRRGTLSVIIGPPIRRQLDSRRQPTISVLYKCIMLCNKSVHNKHFVVQRPDDKIKKKII